MSTANLASLGRGVYSVPEAARLIGSRSLRVRRWVRGYSYRHRGSVLYSQPLFEPEYAAVDNEVSLSFLDVLELRFVAAFRKLSISMQSIRKAADKARRNAEYSNRPFATRAFRTDGYTIFEQVAKEAGDYDWLDLFRSQMVFSEMLDPFLLDLEFSTDGIATRWWPLSGSKRVVIDPRRSFGRPVTHPEGVPTAILAKAYRAEGTYRAAGEFYEVDWRAVRDSVRYEKQLAVGA